MLMLALAALFSTAAGPAALPTQSLHTPDQIAPAVLPYLACLYAARGLPLLRGTDGRPISTGKPIDGDCSPVRRRAQEEALKLLEGKQLPNGTSPESFVVNALSEMDSYVASLPAPNVGNTGNLPIVEAVPVTIEDEVQPAYTKYNTCLRNKVKESPVTLANVLGKFSDALNSCREVRASSVKEATDALVRKGWGEQARQRAAENTFAKADESWTTMGRRLYDALVRRDAATKTASRPKKPQ
jgi:hypothetical protein